MQREAFDCTISGKLIGNPEYPNTNYTININNGLQVLNYKGTLPLWRTDRVTLLGDINVFDEPKIAKFSKYYTYKYEIETLQKNGTLLNLDAYLPSTRLHNRSDTPFGFKIYLLNDINQQHRYLGHVVLMISFTYVIFSEGEAKKQQNNLVSFDNKTWHTSVTDIKLKSYINRKWTLPETYSNPIGTGTRFNLRIDADETHLKIIINNSTDYIYYVHRLPPWVINCITVYLRD
uniref:Galectin n=1 Tax=Meloidogyne hapla TaxID=6305 RepID=A0A1I8B0M8_MELHA